MAKLIERPTEDENENYESLENTEDTEQLEQPVEETVQEVEEDSIPDKYQGKDIKDVVRMHKKLKSF